MKLCSLACCSSPAVQPRDWGLLLYRGPKHALAFRYVQWAEWMQRIGPGWRCKPEATRWTWFKDWVWELPTSGGSVQSSGFLPPWHFPTFKCMSVTQSYPTPCDPMNCSPPGSSVHGILQARIMELGIPNPGIESGSPALQIVYYLSHQGLVITSKDLCCEGLESDCLGLTLDLYSQLCVLRWVTQPLGALVSLSAKWEW